MATNGKVPYGYETPAVAKRREQPPAENPKNLPPWITNTALAGMICFVMVALAVIIANAPRSGSDHVYKLEIKQLGDLQWYILELAGDETNAAQLQDADVRYLRGAEFYEVVLKRRLIDERSGSKLVSLRSETDAKADKIWLDEPSGRMPDNACSYTGPVAGELVEVLARKGDDRAVLITFNSRNWKNYPDHGVIVVWTDGDVAEFLPFEYFEENYSITEEEWADPAGKLFGKKAPFQHTYE